MADETWLQCGPKRLRNRARGSEWLRFKPPRPASKNLRPTEGMASNKSTATPAADSSSAAIKPAGPPPTTKTRWVGSAVMLPTRSGALDWLGDGGWARCSVVASTPPRQTVVVLLVLARAEVAKTFQAWPIVKTCSFHLLIFVTQRSISFCHNFPTLTRRLSHLRKHHGQRTHQTRDRPLF